MARTNAPHRIVIGTADGATVRGYAGSIRYDDPTPATTTTPSKRGGIVIMGAARVGTLYGKRTDKSDGAPKLVTRVTLSPTDTASVLASIGLDPTTTTAATLAGLPAWNDLRASILAGTTDGRGFVLALPAVDDGKDRPLTVNVADATIASRLASMR